MGLDAVELVMALEETFGVELDECDLGEARTPRLMGDVIFRKLQSADQAACHSLQAFHLLQEAFMRQFKLDRSAVTLDMPFRHRIPRSREKDVWADLKNSTGARRWPELVRPRWVVCVSAYLALCAFMLPFVVLWDVFPTGAEVAGIVAAAGMFGMIFLSARVTRRLKTRIPARYRRVRDLVPFVVSSAQVVWTRDQVSVLVKKIVMEKLGLTESKYRDDGGFVKDLGMDS